ncbi:hypothetical protein C8N46_101115 [Kordia periserrulae]|uniref:Uncharacterized protein n=1 Tax=Kordia periserrulae TaxID=701523 RepID=A0A2T6C5D3_9FLAO|nr:hypothetical protein C8N46_101115 [Kordia periserrulae]
MMRRLFKNIFKVPKKQLTPLEELEKRKNEMQLQLHQLEEIENELRNKSN